MSYVLHIWEPAGPLPASIAEAEAEQSRLSEQAAAQNPKFIELARELAERFPAEPEDDYAVWSDEPPTGFSRTAVYVLGVADPRNVEALRAARDLCRTLGLILFDMQAAEACLPDGRVLCLKGREPEVFGDGEDAGRKPSGKQVLAILRKRLEPLMNRHGFIWTRGNRNAAKAVSGRIQKQLLAWSLDAYGYEFLSLETGISIRVYRDGSDWRLDYGLRHPEIDSFSRYATDRVDAEGPAEISWDIRRLLQQLGHPAEPYFKVVPDVCCNEYVFDDTLAELGTWLNVAEAAFEKALPVLAQCRSWAAVDRLSSQGDMAMQPFCKRWGGSRFDKGVNLQCVLMVAWLAGHPALDALAETLLQDYCWRTTQGEPLNRIHGRLLRLLNTPDTRQRPSAHWQLAAPAIEDLPPEAPLAEEAQALLPLRAALQTLLAPRGFAWDDARRAFVRPMADFSQIISPLCETGRRPFSFRLDIHLWDSPRFRELMAIAKEVENDNPLLESGLRASLPMFARYARGPLPPLPEDPSLRMPLACVADVQACADFHLAYLREAVLPVLDECRDWAGVDRYCNEAPVAEQPFGRDGLLEYRVAPESRIIGIDCIAKVLVAVLAGRPDMAAVFAGLPPEEEFKYYPWTSQTLLPRLKALVDNGFRKPFVLALE